jgi:metallo-beta-lactamase class B
MRAGLVNLRYGGKGYDSTMLSRLLVLLSLLLPSALSAQDNPDWLAAQAPFRIVGNVYYVGSKDLASYLIVTPEGDILINSSLKASVPLIKKSVEQLGFKFSDVKILLISHAHSDHAAGSAEVKRLTHAKYMVMDGDVPVVESGGKTDYLFGKEPWQWYEPAKVDRTLYDGSEVRLGGTVLVAHLTPGHTKGCTTWTLKVQDGGKSYDVVIVGGVSINPGTKLVGNTQYPEIAEDFARNFRVLKALPCDVFLGAHGLYFGLKEKLAQKKGGGPNVFVDPEGYKSFVAERNQTYLKELAKQQHGGV